MQDADRSGAQPWGWKAEKWVAAVEPLRGLAALGVAWHHVGQEVWGHEPVAIEPFRNWLGSWGVALFFFISGFCIHLPQAKRAAQSGSVELVWRDFARQRLRRLVPTYVVALLVASLVGALVPPTKLVSAPTWASFFTHLFFIHTWTGHMGAINGVFWTIGVEMHFYFFYPVLLAARRRWGLGPVALALYVIGNLFDQSLRYLPQGQLTFHLHAFFLVTWWEWAAGAWLAEMYLRGSAPAWLAPLLRLPGAEWFWGLASVTLPWLHLPGLPDGLNLRLLPLTCFLFLGAAVVRKPRPSLALRAVNEAGLFSYSLYLIHPVVIAALLPALGALPRWPLALVLLIASIAGGWLLFILIERRFLQQRTKKAAREDPQASPALVALPGGGAPPGAS